MLQIGTGKLFDAPHRRENHLRGRIFTAIDFDLSEKIHTCAGNLQIVRSTDNEQLSELEFEFYEKMEDETGEGVLISRGVETYAFEFSAHLSFAVGCFFSPDENSVQRLSSDSRTFLVPNPANHYTGSFFKKTKLSTITSATEIASYFASAHGLQRKTYLAVTRSIETYINGLQRTADSLETAYSLIVSALESTAALYSAHKKSTWEEYDQGKARKIDHALNGADITIANAVREAILDIEHKTILKGVIEFAKSHVTKNFFTEETVKNNPIQNEDL